MDDFTDTPFTVQEFVENNPLPGERTASMDEVWKQTVDDGAFTCEVIRSESSSYVGTLQVTVTASGQVLLEEEVGLSYEARFGPDVADIQDWQEKAITVIDAYIADKGE